MAELIIKYQKLEYNSEQSGIISIGRDPNNSIVFTDDRVSAHHCEIKWDTHKGAMVRDMGSINGTKILRENNRILVGKRPYLMDREDVRKPISEFIPLKSGDKIRLYSEGILEIEYSIEATRQEVVCDDNSKIHKDSEENTKKYEKVFNDGIEKPAEERKVREESERETAVDKKEEESKEKETNSNADFMEKNQEGEKVICLSATVMENDPEDGEDAWDGILFEKLHESYFLKPLYTNGATALYIATPRAWDKAEEKIVIKILTLDKTANGETAELLFEREKKIAPQLNHPNIIKTYESGTCGNQHYIKMEYCEHNNLADYKKVNDIKFMDEKSAIRIVVQMLRGLHYFHNIKVEYDDKYRRTLKGGAQKLVHRDIKPKNVLVRSIKSNGEIDIVISDFGLAKDTTIGGSSGITSNRKEVRATLEFAPCEQIQYPALVNSGVDIWSTFAVLFWLLTDETPRDMSGCRFDRIEDQMQLNNVKKYFREHEVRKIRDIRADVSDKLATIIDEILSTDQNIKEYSSSEELKLIQKMESMLW